MFLLQTQYWDQKELYEKPKLQSWHFSIWLAQLHLDFKKPIYFVLGKQETGTKQHLALLTCALAGFQGSSGQAEAQKEPNSSSTSAAAQLFFFCFAPLIDFFASLEAVFPTPPKASVGCAKVWGSVLSQCPNF